MITYKQGNILDVEEGVIIHGCNAQGVMGSGVALALRNAYPSVYDGYIRTKNYMGLRLGSVSIVNVTPKLKVVNLISQEFYGRDSLVQYVDYDAIKEGFRKAYNHLLPHNPKIHIPKIGSGLGGGDWDIISKIIEEQMPTFDITCWTL